jgi:Family of unknown function (DUF6118)
MDRDLDAREPADPAARAFEALRREVALLHAAVAGLAAERAAVPDYSETLGEIANELAITARSMGDLASSPALRLTPADVARQITAAAADARRQDREALQRAQTGLERTAGDLRGWIETARLGRVQNWRLLQMGLVGLIGGAALGASLPGAVVNSVPERWAWPEKRAAGLLDRDMWSAGERMLSVADPQRWREIQTAQQIVGQNREALAACARAADKARVATHCLITLNPDGVR